MESASIGNVGSGGGGGQSPLPKKLTVGGGGNGLVAFPEAISALIGGAKIRRKEWGDASEFCLLKDQYLMIHRNNKFHTWIVSEGDLLATDWIII